MRATITPVLLAMSILSTPSTAAETPGDRQARFSLQPVEGGVLRLDTLTGTVSLCARRETIWSCEPVSDRAARPGDAERLVSENAALRAEVDRLQRELADKTATGPKPKFQLPSEEDVDQAMTYLERIIRKFRERLQDLEEPITKKPGTPL